jgi:hypothetical protein
MCIKPWIPVALAVGFTLAIFSADSARAQIGTTVQLPSFGVAVNAEGVVERKTFKDPTGKLQLARLQAAKARLAADVTRKSTLRKVSLTRLEAAVAELLANGKKPDETMRHLAGLQRVQYVFFYPDKKEIVVAGPAEGWMADAAGRPIGMTTGRPVLQLEDLLVALRAFRGDRRRGGFIGCSIDPSAEGLAKLVKFQKTIPRTIPQRRRRQAAQQIGQGMRDSLGMANIRVFGISPKTHFARVLIEADYRMKLIGIGLEPPPVKMNSFASLLRSAKHGTLQRWWFTPNYKCVKVTDDLLGMELVGQGVQLLSEDKLVGLDGRLKSGAPANRPSTLYTQAFTKKYPDIAAASPVFAQMRNLIDLLVASAFIKRQRWAERAGWSMSSFGDEQKLPVETLAAPKQIPAAVNVFWRGSRLFAPAGGGVTIRPDEALLEKNLIADEGDRLKTSRSDVGRGMKAVQWWWD